MNENLKKDQVHLWHMDLDSPLLKLEYIRDLLSTKELGRADRYIDDRNRSRFLMGRGALRLILSHYTQIDADQLIFEYGPKDKPALAESYGDQRVSFNLSHSQDLALIAVAQRFRRIGVDVEKIRDLKQRQNILERYFSKSEQAEYHALPDTQQLHAFFNLWSRKEAFVKAWGESIGSIKMNQLDVSFAPGALARIRAVPDSFAAAKNWLMQDITVGPEYSCCLVAELLSPGETLTVQHFEFNSLRTDCPKI
ncbi:MAG: 4'-phosphopantetheinyl transferase superfamily protein [Bdellovibrionia bacterium]